MMLKKFIAAAAAGATMLTMASGAFAFGEHHDNHDQQPNPTPQATEFKVENTDMNVKTMTDSYASTGWNDQFASAMWGGDVTQRLFTGTASSTALAQVSVGSTFFPSCDCFDGGNIFVKNDDLNVFTMTDSTAKTGGNSQMGFAVKWNSDVFQKADTGNATSRADAQVVVAYTDFQVGE